MGFPYPHYDAEFLAGVFAIGLVAMVALPIARALSSWAGLPLTFLPLILLIAWCDWTWHRVRHG